MVTIVVVIVIVVVIESIVYFTRHGLPVRRACTLSTREKKKHMRSIGKDGK